MSFFNKMLARVGVGAAKIDTILERTEYYPNEDMNGVVHIQGGNVDQEVGNIYIKVMTEYIREHDEKKEHVQYAMAQYKVSDEMVVKKGQKLEIPFSFILPSQTPITFDRQKVWLHTGLDIGMSLDPTDHDYITVHPHPYMETVFQAAELLGFHFHSSSVEYLSRSRYGVPFVQEFEFTPGREFSNRITELELVMRLEPHGLQVLVEVDRRGRGLSGLFAQAFDMDERHAWLELRNSELNRGVEHIADKLENLIIQQSR